MNTQQSEALIRQVHDSPVQLVLAVTGGGSQAMAELLCVPGASRTVLEAVVPYSIAALSRFLMARPEQSCSDPTARAMAVAAFWQAVELAPPSGDRTQRGVDRALAERLIGVACTASLASDRPKRGEHRAHVAVQTAGSTRCCSLVLHKNARSRSEEEQLVSRMILNEVAMACGVDARLELRLLDGERPRVVHTDAPEDWRELFLGALDATCAGGETLAEEEFTSGAIFPGAFNPLHEGHRQMAQIASQMLAAPVELELSITNVDKPPLDYTEIADRLSQFPAEQAIWLTRAATFVEKSRIFPGATFLAGADTVLRIADPRYYGSAQALQAALQEIADHGCRLLVFGRQTHGQFQTLGDLELPETLSRLCIEVPADRFRADVCSTQLRKPTEEADEPPE